VQHHPPAISVRYNHTNAPLHHQTYCDCRYYSFSTPYRVVCRRCQKQTISKSDLITARFASNGTDSQGDDDDDDDDDNRKDRGGQHDEDQENEGEDQEDQDGDDEEGNESQISGDFSFGMLPVGEEKAENIPQSQENTPQLLSNQPQLQESSEKDSVNFS